MCVCVCVCVCVRACMRKCMVSIFHLCGVSGLCLHTSGNMICVGLAKIECIYTVYDRIFVGLARTKYIGIGVCL